MTLTGVAEWVGHCPANQKVDSLIPGQSTYLGCRPGPWSRSVREAADRCFSPSLSPSLLLSIKIKCLKKEFKDGETIALNLQPGSI